MDGEPETIKKVCCEAAITSRTLMTPQYSIANVPLALDGLGARDNDKEFAAKQH